VDVDGIVHQAVEAGALDPDEPAAVRDVDAVVVRERRAGGGEARTEDLRNARRPRPALAWATFSMVTSGY
jgi:hypothetical protein